MFPTPRLEPTNLSQRGAKLAFISLNWRSQGSSLFMTSCTEMDVRERKDNNTEKYIFTLSINTM